MPQPWGRPPLLIGLGVMAEQICSFGSGNGGFGADQEASTARPLEFSRRAFRRNGGSTLSQALTSDDDNEKASWPMGLRSKIAGTGP
jgi:hypothetical protein